MSAIMQILSRNMSVTILIIIARAAVTEQLAGDERTFVIINLMTDKHVNDIFKLSSQPAIELY